MSNLVELKNLVQKEDIQQRFQKLLGKKSQGFISSLLQIVNGNKMLQGVNPQSILNAAVTAAILDLPINQNLGFAWIVPYKDQAQFQLGWKGYVQLALRTLQYENINVIEVYENQFKSFNRLTEELEGVFDIEGTGEVVGYAAFFKLKSGFKKTVYWTKAEVIRHAKKYSQTYAKKNKQGRDIQSAWNDIDQFDAMARKTVIKNMISKYGIMSIEMQTAQLADQSVQQSEGDYNYPDNVMDIEVVTDDAEETARIIAHIETVTDPIELNGLRGTLPAEQLALVEDAITNREKALSNVQ